MIDLLISGGTVVDGTGGPPRAADVAVHRGLIATVAPRLDLEAAEVIDAAGLCVTPGFVDIHTHYDGQMTWDEVLEPSSSHGVTTITAGNCGVGFAPVRPGDEEWLVGLMEGVEDIPGTALYEGIQWHWETFPEYLDAVAARRHAVDVSILLPHGPLRAYVMGERGANNEPAGAADIARMAELAGDAIRAGALGFSSSRTMVHRTRSGEFVPGTFAGFEELLAIGEAVAEAGGGLLEVIPADFENGTGALFEEIELLAKLSKQTGLTVSFPILQTPAAPSLWLSQLDACDRARQSGALLAPQVASRPFGILIGLPSYHAFALRPSFEKLATLPYDELIGALRDPAVRSRILAEDDRGPDPTKQFEPLCANLRHLGESLFVLGSPPDYEPTVERSVASIAARRGCDVQEVLYDMMIEEDGDNFLILPSLNYVDGNHDAIASMIERDGTILGLSDGGAHCRMICDASFPTYQLTHWVRDRSRGPRLPLELMVHKQTQETAELVGLTDRGVIAPGKKADLNVIDLDSLRLEPPRHADDLPAGGRRLLQDAVGYRATIVSGVVTRREDRDTGSRPGVLVRGGANRVGVPSS
jgi:N-acyl-D-aspartate/D-glutamate deacylase